MAEFNKIQKVTVVSLLLILAITAAYYGLRTPPPEKVAQTPKPQGLARFDGSTTKMPQPPIPRTATPVPTETPIEPSVAPQATIALPSTQQTGQSSSELPAATVTTLEVSRRRPAPEGSMEAVVEPAQGQTGFRAPSVVQPVETSATATAATASDSSMSTKLGEPSFGMPQTPSPNPPPVEFGAPISANQQPLGFPMQEQHQHQQPMGMPPMAPGSIPELHMAPVAGQPMQPPQQMQQMQPMDPMAPMQPMQPLNQQQQPPQQPQMPPQMGMNQQPGGVFV